MYAANSSCSWVAQLTRLKFRGCIGINNVAIPPCLIAFPAPLVLAAAAALLLPLLLLLLLLLCCLSACRCLLLRPRLHHAHRNGHVPAILCRFLCS